MQTHRFITGLREGAQRQPTERGEGGCLIVGVTNFFFCFFFVTHLVGKPDGRIGVAQFRFVRQPSTSDEFGYLNFGYCWVWEVWNLETFYSLFFLRKQTLISLRVASRVNILFIFGTLITCY